MPREATGKVLPTANGYSARVRVGPGDEARPCFALSVRGETEAEKRTAILADMAKRRRPLVGVEVLTDAGKAKTSKELDEVEGIVRAIEAGEMRKASSAVAPTFEAFAKDWTSGELRKKHPDHVREKNDRARTSRFSRDSDEPGDWPVAPPDVTLEHAERVMAPCRVARAEDPEARGAMHTQGALPGRLPGPLHHEQPDPARVDAEDPEERNKAKACLWPEEDAKLASCAEVDLTRRLAYGVLTREGMRASELARSSGGTSTWSTDACASTRTRRTTRARGRSLPTSCTRSPGGRRGRTLGIATSSSAST